MNSISHIVERIREFNNERDWAQFHNPKDIAIAISIEANELLECYLWKDSENAVKEKVKEELADVLIYSLMLADKYDFCVEDILNEKISLNALKYPIEKAKGKSSKYNEL